MKVGDLVKFSKKHSSRSGFEYCAKWNGVVLAAAAWADPGWYLVYWTTTCGTSLVGEIGSESVEVISENR